MRTRKQVATDIFAKNDCIVFDRVKAAQMTDVMPDLAALCIVTSEEQLPRDMALLDRANIEFAKSLLFANKHLDKNFGIWLFLAHGPWQPKSVMVKHKKLWKSFPSKWELNDFRLGREVMVESSEGIRFTGVAKVPNDSLFIASQILRDESSCALILSGRDEMDSEESVMHLFNSAFPKRDGVRQAETDWLSLSLNCCTLGDVIMRVSGSWDEREASLDMIMLSENLPRFDW